MKDSRDETLPSSKVNIIARNVGSDLSNYEYFQYDPADGFYLNFQEGQKYEIIITRTWEDPNVTGLSGAIVGTCIVASPMPTNDIGVEVEKIGRDQGDFTITNYNIFNYYDGYLSGKSYDGSNCFFLNINNDNDYSIDYEEILYAISKKSILYSDGNDLLYQEDFTDTNALAKTISVLENAEDDSIEGASLLSNKYCCVYCSSTSSSYYAKVFEYDNSTNPFSKQSGNTYYTLEGYQQIEGVALAESSSGICYVAILYSKSDHNEIVKIYEVGKNEACASCPLSYAIGINNFQVLKDGSFYLEFEPDDSGDIYVKPVRIISENNYEESELKNRNSCVMDKQGFIYRIDTATNSVIKTTSLNGKPIETYTHSTGSGGNNGNLTGIVCLDENPGGSTLYVW